MSGIVSAVIIAALGGLLFFVIGQMLPREWFDPKSILYRCYKWERGGRIYHKLGVRHWKDSVPDMSRIIPGMVKKKAHLAGDARKMGRLIRETCVAELVHWLLIIFVSPMVYRTMRGFGGFLAAAIYALGNMIFIIIQRYNRPRLVEIQKRMEKRKEKC